MSKLPDVPKKNYSVEFIKTRRRAIQQDIFDIQRKASDEIKELGYFLDDLKRNCPHEWSYLPDPSGNNDSEYHCRLCDKYSKRGDR